MAAHDIRFTLEKCEIHLPLSSFNHGYPESWNKFRMKYYNVTNSYFYRRHNAVQTCCIPDYHRAVNPSFFTTVYKFQPPIWTSLLWWKLGCALLNPPFKAHHCCTISASARSQQSVTFSSTAPQSTKKTKKPLNIKKHTKEPELCSHWVICFCVTFPVAEVKLFSAILAAPWSAFCSSSALQRSTSICWFSSSRPLWFIYHSSHLLGSNLGCFYKHLLSLGGPEPNLMQFCLLLLFRIVKVIAISGFVCETVWTHHLIQEGKTA